MARSRFPIAAVGLAALLLACAGGPAPPPADAKPAPTSLGEGGASERRGMHVALIARMLEQDRVLAALAHVEALAETEASRPRARLLRAECLRRLGRHADARHAYRALLSGPAAPDAHRGLGLIAATEEDLPTALASLARAQRGRPTDPRIRNDLGYALLLAGQLAAAETQLATAVELGGGDRAMRNLVLLLYVRDDAESALALARQHGIEADLLEEIETRARALGAEVSDGTRPPGGIGS